MSVPLEQGYAPLARSISGQACARRHGSRYAVLKAVSNQILNDIDSDRRRSYIHCMPNYIECAVCGEIFSSKPSRTKNGRAIYCSRACFLRKTEFPEERFWKKVNKQTENGCWEWTGGLHSGYGQFSVGGRKNARNIRAHRFSYVLTHGLIPDDIDVLHSCDNRKCVRPDHLFTGTQYDNVKDMVSKQRHATGERIGSAVLTETQVTEIRRRFSFGSQNMVSMGKEFGVAPSTIARIRDRLIWDHLRE